MALTFPQHKSLSGMALGATAFGLLTSVDTIFKLLVAHHPAYQILFINACFAFVPVFIWARMTGGLSLLKTIHPLQHFIRASFSVLSAFAAIYAYSRLPLTDYYAIVFAGPLIVTAMSSVWLGEQVERARWLAIAVGFAGILIVADPFGNGPPVDGVGVGQLAALGSVFCYALSVTMIRRMRLSESSLTFTFYGYVTSCLICGAFLVLRGGPELSTSDMVWLCLSGTLSGVATICLMTAYHRTPVSLVAPFQYTQIIWGALAGYAIWGHVPEVRLVAGAIIVAACGLFVIYQEMRGKMPMKSSPVSILTINEQ